jgi:hypothetical protein
VKRRNNILHVKLQVKYEDRDYTVYAEENPMHQTWEQWGAPSDVLKKTVSRVQEIFREQVIGKAKGVFRGIY